MKTPIEVEPYLLRRIPQILEDVIKTSNLTDVSKVMIMMLTATPIPKELRNRLNKIGKVITDEKERIVFFKEKDVELQQNYSQLEPGYQQLPIVPAKAASLNISESQIRHYLQVIKRVSENETVPLSVQEIEAAYNESTDKSCRIPNLSQKIPRLNEEIFSCEEIPDSSKIKMLFATQTSINDYFLERMRTHKTRTGLILDQFDRIIKFQSNEPSYEMNLEREITWDSTSTINPVPWGQQEISQFFEFFHVEALTARTTMDLQALCLKYERSKTTKRTVDQLYDKFHKIITGNMDNVQRLEYIEKANILFAFGISPHPELLKKFYKTITFQLDGEQKIIYSEHGSLRNKIAFGTLTDSRPLSRPVQQENYKSFLRKIAQRNDPKSKNELVAEFLLDYPHFDTRENVENFFENLDNKFLKAVIRNFDSYWIINQIKPTKSTKKTAKTPSTSTLEFKFVKPRPPKRKRSLTPPDQVKGKSYRSRPRGEPRVEQVEEKPSALIDPENNLDIEDAHHEDPEPLHQNYDDYEYFDRGSNEEQPMDIGNTIHEDRELNNQINTEYKEDNRLMINQIQGDDQSEMVRIAVDDGNQEPMNNKERNVKFPQENIPEKDETSEKEPHVEEETYDRKKALRLVFVIYDSILFDAMIEKNKNEVENMCKDVKNDQISMKGIIDALQESLQAIEAHLSPSELRNSTNSRLVDTICLLFRQMAMNLKSSLSEKIIQEINTLENEKSLERILIEPLIGVLNSFFLELFTLPPIPSEKDD